jgi:hypothetical protein
MHGTGGALLAFNTRSVSANYNESKAIAWSLYNFMFAVGIISPILVVVGAMGDTLVLLLAFLLLWLMYFTGFASQYYNKG